MHNLFGCIFSVHKNSQKFSQVIGKIKNYNCKHIMDLKSWAIELPKSHVQRTCSIITLSVLIVSLQLLQTIGKKNTFLISLLIT